MCGRYTLRTNLSLIAEAFQVDAVGSAPPRFNVAPETLVAGIRRNDRQTRELIFFQWGLIPSWSKDPKVGRQLINARGETVATKPSFRAAFRSRRCLILADGFFEWKRDGRKKQPYYIRLSEDRPFAFAGLWEQWRGGDQVIESCTIITTEANELIRPLHDRMPVILDSADYEDWLNPHSDRGPALLRPFPPDRMTYYPVSDLVNRATNNLPECIEPFQGKTQRTLFD